MTDIHTHILPGIDDGSKSPEMSLKMLRIQLEQGVDTVVLTPHFYRKKETPDSFLRRREEAFNRLCNKIDEDSANVPNLFLGAEVAMAPGISGWEELPELCIQGTNNLLLEMPFHRWTESTINQIYEIMDKRGITPVFAHLERYFKDQDPKLINEIISMGTPIQVSSSPWLSFSERRLVKKMVKNGWAHMLASDCHNLTTRLPNLGDGLKMVRKIFDDETADVLIENADSIVYA